jgi:hypothetical protein
MTFAPICVPCRREMRCRKNDYMFFDYGKAAIWSGDKYQCEACRAEVVVGFGIEPLALDSEPAFNLYCDNAQLALTR